MKTRRVCVFCGSTLGSLESFQKAVLMLAAALIKNDLELVYGGGGTGLMGALADEMLRLGGRVTGVIPKALLAREVGHPSISEMHVVADMLERKAVMAQLADASIALPGGYGTIDELFEMLTWLQLQVHEKPVGLLNISNYYDHLLRFLDQGVGLGFIRAEHRALLHVDEEPLALLNRLEMTRD